MAEHEPVPEKMRCLCNALSNAGDSTAMRVEQPPGDSRKAVLITAFANLITALTGVAGLLLYRS